MFETETALLLKGDARIIFSSQLKKKLVEANRSLLSRPMTDYTEHDYQTIGEILHIGNLIYNNTDLSDDENPVDSDFYDLILERYRDAGYTPQVGAEPIHFDNISRARSNGRFESIPLIRTLSDDRELWYDDDLLKIQIPRRLDQNCLIQFQGYESDKKYRSVAHENPNLVGTLDKTKFVLNKQADDKGCLNDPSTKIFERDFLAVHLMNHYINAIDRFRMVLELKYDGISVVCHIKHGMVVFAYSRGDTEGGQAMDYTPILYGYRFPNLPFDADLEVKFEAVISYQDLALFNQAKGKEYANPRSAIIGLFGNNDGYLYRDFITLVPLAVASYDENNPLPEMSRIEEITFLNKYVATKEPLRYAMIEGDYNQILFFVKMFASEAEYVRDIMPILYDGIVVSYNDIEMRHRLGRENFVNKYSVAVKFNPRKKFTTVIDIGYEVGSTGVITPMIYFEPVVFMGGINTKSSLSSVGRLNDGQFKIGNKVEIEYRNDVMAYVTNLPELEENINNPNPVIQFIGNKCPVCGGEVEYSETGKSARCLNMSCPGRAVSRMDNMMKKLRLKDISFESIDKLKKTSLTELLKISREEAQFILGEANGLKLMRNIEDIKTNPRFDFELVGSLGISNQGQRTWEKIFNAYTLEEFVKMWLDTSMREKLLSITGIGPGTVDVIENELSFFMDDIVTIMQELPYVSSKGRTAMQIRCSGFRDGEFMEYLRSRGYDADDNAGVTKKTDILLVPNDGYTSSKTKKVGPNTAIIPIADFKEHLEEYLSRY